MRNPPEGWPRISSALFYDDAAAAIDWLGRAFGFEVRLEVRGDEGTIVHSELVFGGGVVMVASSRPVKKSPRAAGGANTQCLCVYVDDIEAHHARALAAGAKVTIEPVTKDYGGDWGVDRGYEAEDPEGHHWWFSQRLRDPKAQAGGRP